MYYRYSNGQSIKKIYYFYLKYDAEYTSYQSYYLEGLRDNLIIKKIEYVRSDILHSDKLEVVEFSQKHATHVGQYIFLLKNGFRIKVAIDSHDHREIRSKEILAWSDIYFKSNHWPILTYDKKVYPIVNGNGDLTYEKIKFLKSIINKEKKYDFVFVSRIWAGGDANAEHNLRLFETLSKVTSQSKILAIFVGFEVSDPTFTSYRNRLDEAGVSWTFDHIEYKELMLLSAQSKCTIIRAGISSCIPWRMLDLLCLGVCIVVDNSPYPRWPVPLINTKNYFSLDLRIHRDAKPAPSEDYEGIIEKMRTFLSDSTGQKLIRDNNTVYFENHAHPTKVAKYIINTISDKYNNNYLIRK